MGKKAKHDGLSMGLVTNLHDGLYAKGSIEWAVQMTMVEKWGSVSSFIDFFDSLDTPRQMKWLSLLNDRSAQHLVALERGVPVLAKSKWKTPPHKVVTPKSDDIEVKTGPHKNFSAGGKSVPQEPEVLSGYESAGIAGVHVNYGGCEMEIELQILESSTKEERNALARLLGETFHHEQFFEKYSIDGRDSEETRAYIAETTEELESPESIAKLFRKLSQSVFGRMMSDAPTYKGIVVQCLNKLGVTYSNKQDVRSLEVLLVQHVISTAWDKMTDEQRADFQKAVEVAASELGLNESKLKALGPIGALSAASLSGFGIYLFASSAIGLATGLVGVTLPFAAYTAVSTGIAAITGPVGWLGAGLFAVWKLTGPKYKRLIPAIMYMSVLRETYDPLPTNVQKQ